VLRGGNSDPRGIYVADGLVGKATVIAQSGDQFAFYRGTGVHQPARYQPAPEHQPQQAGQKEAPVEGRAFDAWENNLRLNNDNRARQVLWLKNEVMDKQQRGVEVYRAK